MADAVMLLIALAGISVCVLLVHALDKRNAR